MRTVEHVKNGTGIITTAALENYQWLMLVLASGTSGIVPP